MFGTFLGGILTLEQTQTLSPQQQFALRILQSTSVELQAQTEAMLEDNPLLERESTETSAEERNPQSPSSPALAEEAHAEPSGELPDDRGPLENVYAGWQSHAEDDSPIERVAAVTTLREALLADWGELALPEPQHTLVRCLIEELNDDGRLEAPLSTIAQEYRRVADAPLDAWTQAKQLLQTRFEPAGIGASSAAECLSLQADRAVQDGRIDPTAGALLSKLLLSLLSALAAKDRKALLKAAKAEGADEAALDRALALLPKLNPHPAASFCTDPAQYVVADLFVVRQSADRPWQAVLNPDAFPMLRVSALASRAAVGERTPYGRYLTEARRFVEAVRARQETLFKTAAYAVERQQAFFNEGRSALEPLSIAQTAQALGLAESTVSRAVSGKFLQGPQGMMELRALFTRTGGSLGASGSASGAAVVGPSTGEASQAQIRARIAALIAQEPPEKPLSDQKLTDMLNAEGLSIMRRTVAKYRDLEGLPPARLRKRRP